MRKDICTCRVLLITCSLLALLPLAVQAQPVDPSQMLPSVFDQLVITERKKGNGDTKEPLALAQILLQRFEEGRFTSDDSVIAVTQWYTNYESKLGEAKNATGNLRYPLTLAFISRLLPLVYKRDELEAALHKRAAELYLRESKDDKAQEELEKCYQLLSTQHISVDKQKVDAAISLGSVYLSRKNRDAADKMYLEVIRYPWPQLNSDPDAMMYVRERYVDAAKGLIYLRSTNLKALKELHFYPAVMGEIGPLLQETIAKAQKEQDEREAILKATIDKEKGNQPPK